MKRIVLIYLSLAICINSSAQRRLSIPFSSNYDEDAPVLLGINYSYINSKYIVNLRENALEQTLFSGNNNHTLYLENLQSIYSSPSHGVSVGIPVDFRITDHWYASFHPNFTFINRTSIRFNGESYTGEEKILERRLRHLEGGGEGTNFNSFDFPFRTKLRSEEKHFLNKQNRYRVYISGGVKLTRWIGIVDEYAQLRSRPIDMRTHAIIMKPEYVSWEVAVGTEIFFTYFKMSPEIRFSQSFGNILAPNHELSRGNEFMKPLDSVLARGIYFTLIFQ